MTVLALKALKVTFLIFSIISVGYTIFIAVVSNTLYRQATGVLYPIELVKDSAQAHSNGCYIHSARSSPVPTACPGSRAATFLPPALTEERRRLHKEEVNMLSNDMRMVQLLAKLSAQKLWRRSKVSKLAPVSKFSFDTDTVLISLYTEYALFNGNLLLAHVSIAATLSFVFLLVFSLLSVILVLSRSEGRRAERLWSIILIASVILYFNLLPNIIRALDITSFRFLNFHRIPLWLRTVSGFFEALRNAMFVPTVQCFILVITHLSRKKRTDGKLSFVSFFLPKLLFCAIPALLCIASYYAKDFLLSEAPILSLFTMVFSLSRFKIWTFFRTEVILAAIHSLWDLLALLLISSELIRTSRVRSRDPNSTFRISNSLFTTYRLVFSAFLILYIAIYVVIVFATPKFNIANFILFFPAGSRATPPTYFTAGAWWIVAGFAIVCAGLSMLEMNEESDVMSQ